MPLLTANDIECRVGQVKKADGETKGLSLLLYKDARCDMAILDKVFGSFSWKREHIIRENVIGNVRTMVNYCKVSIYDHETKEWVSKEDVGTESNTENAKGEASDAFKRACVNWGIGRELYTAPFIWIKPEPGEQITYTKFFVKEIGYDKARNIGLLKIVDNKGVERYSYVSNVYVTETAFDEISSAIEIGDEEKFKKSVNKWWRNLKDVAEFQKLVNDGKEKFGL